MRSRTLLSAALVLASASLASAQTFTKVALQGDPVPQAVGINPHIWSVSSPLINEAGQVAFAASLAINNAISGKVGIMLWSPSGLNLLAQSDQPAPGTGGATYDNLPFSPTLGDGGHVGFNATIEGSGVTGSNREGNWVSTTAGTQLLARTGDPSPVYGAIFEGMGAPRLLTNGSSIFGGAIIDPTAPIGHGAGIWYGPVGGLQMAMRLGGPAPDRPAGTIVNDFFGIRSSDNGRVALGAVVTEPGPSTKQVLYWGTPGNLQVAVEGNAPGTTAQFSRFDAPAVNRLGHIAFNAHLTGASIDDSNNEGIWIATPTAVELVARIGDQAPGTPIGTKFSANDNTQEDQWDPLTEPTINSSGQIAFRARFDGLADATNNWGIYAGDAGSLQLLARSGDAAPGAGAGVTFKGSVPGGEWIAPFQSPIINDLGQVAFVAALAGPGLEEYGNKAIYATDASGELHLIVREGQMFDVGGGDLRHVSSLGFASYDDSVMGSTSFNSQGQLVFTLSFGDGSNGIFIATVPEPTLTAMILLAGPLLLRRRRL